MPLLHLPPQPSVWHTQKNAKSGKVHAIVQCFGHEDFVQATCQIFNNKNLN
jgi:hypothetical protein